MELAESRTGIFRPCGKDSLQRRAPGAGCPDSSTAGNPEDMKPVTSSCGGWTGKVVRSSGYSERADAVSGALWADRRLSLCEWGGGVSIPACMAAAG